MDENYTKQRKKKYVVYVRSHGMVLNIRPHFRLSLVTASRPPLLQLKLWAALTEILPTKPLCVSWGGVSNYLEG